LQAEIKKTIVMVTHDIDEALTLGDRIAVLAPGGVLHQYASPLEILTRPATDFVASMVSKDRGFRQLSFATLQDVDASALGAPGADGLIDLGALAPGWKLRPGAFGGHAAWLDPSGAEFAAGPGVRRGDTVRSALDAVLASPVSAAPLVNGDSVPRACVTIDDLAPYLRHGVRSRA
jgi:osmoprotectant transport system ATP-binding protein